MHWGFGVYIGSGVMGFEFLAQNIDIDPNSQKFEFLMTKKDYPLFKRIFGAFPSLRNLDI